MTDIPLSQMPSREVFGNIAPWMRLVFYGMILGSLGVLAWQVGRQARLWWRGKPGGFEKDWRLWVRRLATFALAQKRVHRKSLGGALHLLLFSGFVVLTVGTTLLMIADQGPVNFHRGWYYLIYELTMDTFGVALCAGCLLAIYRRLFRRPVSLGHTRRDWALLGLLLALGVTGFLLEALRLHYTQVVPGVARWSVIGHVTEMMLFRHLDIATTRGMHLGFWWVHAILVAVLFAAIPVTRFLHVITGPLNIALRPAQPVGALAAVNLGEVEQTGLIGAEKIEDFTRQQLLSLDACMECGRCEDACPAWASGKPLSPKAVVVNLRGLMSAGSATPRALHGDTIAAETLWACTMCQACVQECPVLIGHVDLISDMRRNRVAEGQIAGPPAKALNHLSRQFNPYGQPNLNRLDWAAGLNVPTVESNPQFEVLLWVGCAASFDPRAQNVARSLALLLKEASVNFAVLGTKERCTGDPARRLGEEFAFQESARANVDRLNASRVRRIVTPCPHCFNTLQNEYPQFGGQYQVQHHSQLLAELLKNGRLQRNGKGRGTITIHDPCYLARANDETAAPRTVIDSSGGSEVREMPRHGRKTFCCGAGGGRMWFEEAPGQRVSHLRAQEALGTGAKTLATACPFCLNMMSDAMSAVPGGEGVTVLDIAEVLAQHGKQNTA
jgi:Fe-S oxidoreductase/nitrate reductase gamma subunit